MTTLARIVDAPSLPSYDFGPGHPFAADRQQPLFELLEACHLIDSGDRIRPAPATAEELRLAHVDDYVEVVAALSKPVPEAWALARAARHGMGPGDNPIHEGLHEGARAIAGATLACVREVVAGRCRRAFNPAGGLHHAMPDRASGFCIYNDLVIGIREARRLGVERVLYVDLDVHHGDGVQGAFWRDASVATVSFHEDPAVRWPGTGEVDEIGEGQGKGFSVNVPFASGTTDESWLHALESILVPYARRFAPDLIVSQHGCDPHHDDPLADLSVSTQAMAQAARRVGELADELCEGRWVATGGGGYLPYRVLPRVWTMLWADLAARPLPDRVDPDWAARWAPRSPLPVPETFFDPPFEEPRAAHAAARNRVTLDRLRRLHGL